VNGILFRVWKNFRIEKSSPGRSECKLSRSVPLRSIILYRIEFRKFEAICEPFMKTGIWIFFFFSESIDVVIFHATAEEARASG
jgi:hypothetical protein